MDCDPGERIVRRELINDAVDAAALALSHGLWRWTGGLGVAPRLQETVAARIGSLGGPERTLVEALAVGEPLRLASAERVAPTVSISDLERRNLVALEKLDHHLVVRLAHPLFGETVRATMPKSLRRQICHELAEDLERTGDRQPADTLRLAALREGADEICSPELLAEAARTANSLSDHELAERLARASVSEDRGFDGEFELGRALLGQSRFEDAATVLGPLVGCEPNDDAREQLAEALTEVLAFGLDRVDDARAILESAERGVANPVTRALLRGHRASLLAVGGRFGEAAELGLMARESVDDEVVRLRSISSVAGALVMSGRIDDALALTDGALDAASHLQDRLTRAQGWVLTAHARALFFAGRSAESFEFIDLALASISNAPPQLVARGERVSRSVSSVQRPSSRREQATKRRRPYPSRTC